MTDRPSYNDLAGEEGLKGVPESKLRKMLRLEGRDDVTVINLDDQRAPPEVVTAGWTDSQIKAKSADEIVAMVNSAQMGIQKLHETMRQEQDRLTGLLQVQKRKQQLGGP